jgi:hypothetical protein
MHFFIFYIYENTSLSVQHKYKVTVYINNSEGDKIVLKVNQWIDACIYAVLVT